MTTRTVIKHMAVLQDLLIGEGQAIQIRNGVSYTVDKVQLLKFITTTTALASVDPLSYRYVALLSLATSTIVFYRFSDELQDWVIFNTVSDQVAMDAMAADIAALDAALAVTDAAATALAVTVATAVADILTNAVAIAATDVIVASHTTDLATLTATVNALGAPIEALLYKTGDQSIPHAGAAISWDVAAYQDNATFWVVGSPTRISVPVGVSRVKLLCNFAFLAANGAAGAQWVAIRKNGAATYYPGKGSVSRPQAYNVGAETGHGQVETAWIDVVGGTDYFEVWADTTGTTYANTIKQNDGESGTWIQILGKP